MNVLIDSNLLLRIADKGSPMHIEAVSAVDELDAKGHKCCIVPQILYEYWVVASRPIENNGLGMPPADVELALEQWARLFHLLLDERGVFSKWKTLVTTYAVKGKNAHDARLVAAMQRHELSDILTYNRKDFVRFSFINVFTPGDILSGNLFD